MASLTLSEVEKLLMTTETFRVERTISTSDTDKFCEAICSFANDMPDSRAKGYLFVGVYDDGRRAGLRVTDKLLKDISSIRSDGNILPMPVMNVSTVTFPDGDVVIVEVEPSNFPPVRYHGRTCIRIGPRRGIATPEEESILIERRAANFPTFDCTPCQLASLEDLDVDLFKREYLPKAIAADVLQDDTRPIERQLEALSFYSTRYNCPTYAGLILFGRSPERFLFGSYVQYVQFQGEDRASDIGNQQEFRGSLLKILPKIDTFIETAVAKKRPVPVSALREELAYEYPKWPIRELVMNALMHRDYKGNAPAKFYQYSDRLEIENPGGLYGKATRENFPDVSDYRNPIIAQAMVILGYVNKFGRGISRVQAELDKNGNPPATFGVELVTAFKVTVLAATDEGLLQQQAVESARIALRSGEIATRGVKGERILRVFDIISQNNEITLSALSDAVSLSKRTVSGYVEEMKGMGILTREGGTYGGRWKIHAPLKVRSKKEEVWNC